MKSSSIAATIAFSDINCKPHSVKSTAVLWLWNLHNLLNGSLNTLNVVVFGGEHIIWAPLKCLFFWRGGWWGRDLNLLQEGVVHMWSGGASLVWLGGSEYQCLNHWLYSTAWFNPFGAQKQAGPCSGGSLPSVAHTCDSDRLKNLTIRKNGPKKKKKKKESSLFILHRLSHWNRYFLKNCINYWHEEITHKSCESTEGADVGWRLCRPPHTYECADVSSHIWTLELTNNPGLTLSSAL